MIAEPTAHARTADTEDTPTPRVYVACLASYNSGRLHGEWVELDDDDAEINAETLQDGIQAVLSGSPVNGAEEWAFHDYDGFEGLGNKLGEHAGVEDVAAVAAALVAAGDNAEALAAFYEMDGCELEQLEDRFEEAYQGEWDSVKDYAQQFVDDTGMLADVADTIAVYFNYDAYARDLELGGDIWTHRNSSGLLFVFNNHI